MGDSASRAWSRRYGRRIARGRPRSAAPDHDFERNCFGFGDAGFAVGIPILDQLFRTLVGFASRLWSFGPTPFDAAK